jgi:hypothetical protein
MALPFNLGALGVGGSISAGALGAGGSFIGGKTIRALGESMGMSEAGVLMMETPGGLGGGIFGGSAAARRFVVKPIMPKIWVLPVGMQTDGFTVDYQSLLYTLESSSTSRT